MTRKGGAPFGPRSPAVIRALALVRRWLDEGRPVYERGQERRGLFAEAAREVGLSPQQVQRAWGKYGGTWGW